jgi:hypothetical protein
MFQASHGPVISLNSTLYCYILLDIHSVLTRLSARIRPFHYLTRELERAGAGFDSPVGRFFLTCIRTPV